METDDREPTPPGEAPGDTDDRRPFSEIARGTSRLARWLSNLMWGIRYARVRAGTTQPARTV